MANRRMVSIDHIENDLFWRMTPSAQALYFHLILNADDDGFVDKWKSLLRCTGIGKAHFKTLVDSGLIMEFESGVALITDWNAHNRIRRERYKPSRFQEEYNMVTLDRKNRYYLKKTKTSGDKCAPQDSVGKGRIGNDSQGNDSQGYDSIGVTTKKSYIRSYSGEKKQDFHEFIKNVDEDFKKKYGRMKNDISLYFLKNYQNSKEIDKFIAYYEDRFWMNDDGEMIVECVKDYIDLWMEGKK